MTEWRGKIGISFLASLLQLKSGDRKKKKAANKSNTWSNPLKHIECSAYCRLKPETWQGGQVPPCAAVRSINIYLFQHSQLIWVSDCLSEWTQNQVKKELIIHDCLLTCSPPLKHVWAVKVEVTQKLFIFLDVLIMFFSVRGQTITIVQELTHFWNSCLQGLSC